MLEAVVILKSEICNERDESVYRQIKKIELTLYNSKYTCCEAVLCAGIYSM